MKIVPISLEEANSFVVAHHRHHGPVVGHKFSIAISDEKSSVRGVCIVGRPISRILDDGWTLEMTRLCTDGYEHAACALARSAWRAVLAMGYRRLITYTLDSETGASLKGAGFRLVGGAGGGSWDRPSRPPTSGGMVESERTLA